MFRVKNVPMFRVKNVPTFRVKNVPMFRDFAPKMDPCLGILLQKQAIFKKFSENFKKMDPCLGILGPKMGPMFRDFGAKNRPIWAAHPRIAFLWEYPPRACTLSTRSVHAAVPKDYEKYFTCTF